MESPMMATKSRRHRPSRWSGKHAGKIFDLAEAQELVPAIGELLATHMAVRKARSRHRSQAAVPATVSAVGDTASRSRLPHDASRANRTGGRSLATRLRELGATLLERRRGIVGIPTIINGAAAYYVFRHGDARVGFWCYHGRTTARRLPRTWVEEAAATSL